MGVDLHGGNVDALEFEDLRALLTTGVHCPECTRALAPFVARSTCDTICRRIDHDLCEGHTEC